jgi:hypothetical protein
MEERSGAHRMTQRLLVDPPQDGSPVESDGIAEPETGTPPARPEEPVAAPTVPRGPSDTELRKRQRAWRGERARFEASRKRPPSGEERAT